MSLRFAAISVTNHSIHPHSRCPNHPPLPSLPHHTHPAYRRHADSPLPSPQCLPCAASSSHLLTLAQTPPLVFPSHSLLDPSKHSPFSSNRAGRNPVSILATASPFFGGCTALKRMCPPWVSITQPVHEQDPSTLSVVFPHGQMLQDSIELLAVPE